ncbi:MAG: sodium-dependent transporter [Oligoflexales bacterium]
MEERWKHHSGFIMAAVGAAVGLGNLWKFPFITGVHGGGAFVMVYLLSLAFIGIPALWSEVGLGVKFQLPMWKVLPQMFGGHGLALLCFLSMTLVVSFYSVVGGWILACWVESWDGSLFLSTEVAQSFLSSLQSQNLLNLSWQYAFLLCSFGVVTLGVQSGIEMVSRLLMPLLLALLLILLAQSFTLPGFHKACDFLFVPHFEALGVLGVQEAMGHAFFTLSVGGGAMMTYGSYLERGTSLAKPIFWIVVVDTLVALMAGLVIFSCVFSYDVEPAAGPVLVFQTLPVLFSQMKSGWFFGNLFFMLVFITALTSMLSLIEVLITFFMTLFDFSRKKSALCCLVWLFAPSLLCGLSWHPDSQLAYAGKNIFEWFDFGVSSFFIPIGGLCFVLLYGWCAAEHLLGKIVCRWLTPTLLIGLFVRTWWNL